MAASTDQIQKLKLAISKKPTKAGAYLDYARSKGFTEDDIQQSLPRPGEALPGSLGEMFQKSAVGQELQAAGEGFVHGMSAGIVDPRASKPTTVNLPFFGETSPSRAIGTVVGGVTSPIVRGAGAVGQIIAGRAAPAIVSGTGAVPAAARALTSAWREASRSRSTVFVPTPSGEPPRTTTAANGPPQPCSRLATSLSCIRLSRLSMVRSSSL